MNHKFLNQINKAELESRFRDITSSLKEGALEDIRKYDIIKGVDITGEEMCDSEENPLLYTFVLEGFGLEGRIFPFDEIVYPTQNYNVIIQKPYYKRNKLFIDSQIFHEFKLGEKIPVKVSRKSLGFDPSFKLFNRISGLINNSRNGLYEKLEVGSKVLVEVHYVYTKHEKIIILTYPEEIIS